MMNEEKKTVNGKELNPESLECVVGGKNVEKLTDYGFKQYGDCSLSDVKYIETEDITEEMEDKI